MPKSIHSKKISRFCLPLFFVAALLISGCGKQKNEVTMQPVFTSTPPVQQSPTQKIVLPVIETTPAPTLLPAVQPDLSVSNAGLIILSMSEGQNKHLFAYHPSYLPLTRLTADEWNDESPVISPDGNRVAFSSNRFGTYEIYILDLINNSISQLTNSKTYKNSISWSPDGQYIVYEIYENEQFSLIIQSVDSQNEAPIQLYEENFNFFQPAWSPNGSEIAFVTDRNGHNELWIARLQDPDERFVKILGSPSADFSHPAWSPDGLTLAATRRISDDEVVLINPGSSESPAAILGKGSRPVWMPDGKGILVTLEQPNSTELLAYSIADRHLIFPPIPMPSSIDSADWKASNLATNIQTYLAKNSIPQPTGALVEESISESETGRKSLVELDNVTAPQPSLSDAVDDRFLALRKNIQNELGWDVLATLENAVVAATENSMPQIVENWLYTGRAFSLNMAPYEAGYLVAVREEFLGEIYWRIWLKCKEQDGTCGQPLQNPVWDFNSRFSGDPLAYENGGMYVSAPHGYWVDFTDLARQFGWERLPSQNNWRSYFPAIQFNLYVVKQELTWQQALSDIYPPEQVELIMGIQQ